MDELNQNIDSLEVKAEDEREFAPVPPEVEPNDDDPQLDNFIDSLSPEDRETIEVKPRGGKTKILVIISYLK